MASTFSTSPRSTPRADLLQHRRFLVLTLPRWATDCLKRREPALGQSTLPLVVYERQKGALRIAALDALAARHGLTLGQSLADARAQVPALDIREIDRGMLENVFADFADWHSYASPMVSVLTDATPYGDLVLDITGVSHLFGGEDRMIETITGRLGGLGFSVVGAIASTIGAAWAVAHYGGQQVLSTDIADALGDLPVSALRLDEEQVSGLIQIGLKRIGQLYGRDRKALQARFGGSLLTRLDQALGFLEERMTPRLPLAERFVERRFADPIGLMDDVLMCAHDLAVTLAIRLEGEGMGAKSFHLLLYRVDYKVMVMSVNAGRATRDPDHIARLFAHRSERLEGDYDAGFGIDMIRLAAGSITELDPLQIGAFEIDNGAENLERLYDRMTSRLGPLAVLRPKFINTHIPEQAVMLEPVIARTDDDPHAAPDPLLVRPLRLLAAPEPISVIAQVPDGPPASMVWRRIGYRFAKASGPERIAAEWWAGKDLPILTAATEVQARDEANPAIYFDGAKAVRDYYVAEDDGGRRFWVFREGLYAQPAAPRWFMHGFFS